MARDLAEEKRNIAWNVHTAWHPAGAYERIVGVWAVQH